jgi:hypothetical protein
MGGGTVDNPAHAFRQTQGTAAMTWLSTKMGKLGKDFMDSSGCTFSPKLALFPEQI